MKIYSSITDLIGKTPLIHMKNIENKYNIKAKIIAKLEYFNPAGSVKDRVAYNMIKEAEKIGKLKKGSVIIEPTSGNTGIGLAMVGSSRGYRVILTMPETMSAERRSLLKAYGAEIILTPGREGMSGAIKKAEEIAADIDNSFIPGQFTNIENPAAHKNSTGPEIWEDTDGNIDIFVACVGTGGTLTGVGEYLKEKNSSIKVIAVEPDSSPILSKGYAGAHKIQGIGAGFIPDVLNRDIYDEIIAVTDDEAYEFSKAIARGEGFLSGISSGAALCAAVKAAMRKENEGKNIVVLFPDAGERYLSLGIFD